MPDELEERLRSHASAFDSLLSLIPAKLYYGEDVSDQWQRKKQTPEQKRAARMAKLDPDNAKSAKDVMDERAAAALKRKREEDDDGEVHDGPTEKQREGLKVHDRKEKKRKMEKNQSKSEGVVGETAEGQSVEDQKQRKVEKKAAKKERKQAKQLKAQQKAERKKAHKEAARSNDRQENSNHDVSRLDDEEGDLDMIDAIDIGETNRSSTHDRHSTASPSPELKSPILSPQLHSGSSSISSIQPPLIPPSKQPAFPLSTSKPTPLPSTPLDPHELTPQQRLEARIAALRASRKADGPDGRPPRNRQELLESRRRKEEERRKHKKELRRQAKEEETRKQEREIAQRFSPGGSASLIGSPRSPMEPGNNNFSFGRVAFGDGTQTDASLSSLVDPHKKKGASDPATALKAAQNKASRLSALDEAKRADIQQKDVWLNAKKKAHGERVRDDTSLLKKALKRQEGGKKKSEKEWQGRMEGVAKSQEIRQRKREGNLAKRREEKGGKTKKKGKAGAGKKNKVKRPGFEGSFKTKNSSSAKK